MSSPFGGGASVLLNRERMPVEVYNDLDGALVNLLTVVRDDTQFADFCGILSLTPYSRDEFEKSLDFEKLADPVYRAAAFYTVINQSISGKRLARRGDWARGRSDNLAERWFLRQDKLGEVHRRIRSVQIECRDALDILEEWDTPDTTFYCDPPYILETRTQRKYYAIEPGDEYHERLVDVLLNVKGNVVLSGYDHPIYRRLLDHGWWTDTYGAAAVMEVTKVGGTKKSRVEIVYRNPRCAEMGISPPLNWDEEGRDLIARASVSHVKTFHRLGGGQVAAYLDDPLPAPDIDPFMAEQEDEDVADDSVSSPPVPVPPVPRPVPIPSNGSHAVPVPVPVPSPIPVPRFVPGPTSA